MSFALCWVEKMPSLLTLGGSLRTWALCSCNGRPERILPVRPEHLPLAAALLATEGYYSLLPAVTLLCFL